MLYEAIRLGCEKYHQGGYGEAYPKYLRQRDFRKWNNPECLDDEARKAVRFVNEWNVRMPSFARM